MTDTTAGRLKQEIKVVGVVSGGHFMSHCYGMILPPLFPILHAELGVPYTALGLLLSLKSLSFGVMQLPAGILVDRFGARLMLVFGFAIILTSYLLISLVETFWLIGVLFVIAGIGDSVFHPADYSIMNGTVAHSRMGRSFSTHIFAGYLGMGAAPAVVLFMIGVMGWTWREVIQAFVVVGLVVIAGLFTQWQHIREAPDKPQKPVKPAAERAANAGPGGGEEQTTWQAMKQILTSVPMLFLLLFFSFQALGSGAFKNFAVAGLVSLHGTSLEAAGGALSGFLFATAVGALCGGLLADRFGRHATIATVALAVSAAIAVMVGMVDLHYMVLVFAFTMAGLLQGIIRPARDMMIRAASPKGSIGKAFGFVNSGQAIGGTIAPVLLGALLDIGMPQWLFYCSAIFLLICMLTVLGSAHWSRKERRAAARG
ncbi:MAG: MFS transporter [Alphaproteobacteria bacterium]|nr:MFS transporter [Pseudomonadota bacterium]TDI66825.1 MAG: MFS transporter [Alphaproteobacteria bacterium]